MKNVTAAVSMIHELGCCDSATRLFRGEPVLAWTLRRLRLAARVDRIAILCWEEQLPQVRPIAAAHDAYVLAKGPAVEVPQVRAITAARKWADGWRGGLLGTCDFDAGFYAPWFVELADRAHSDALLLVGPAAALVDPALVDEIVAHAHGKEADLFFAPAAPGLGAALVRRALLDRLAGTLGHPGRQLHYSPDINAKDPLATEACVAVPMSVARTTHRFTLDSDRQVARMDAATLSLNGQLIQTRAEELVHRFAAQRAADLLPRDVVLELTPRRATSPVYWPGRHADLARPDLAAERAAALFAELAAWDDVRLTLGGVGDALLHPDVIDIIAAAAAAGVHSVHVETDFVGVPAERVTALAASAADVVSVFLPGATAETYERIMGANALHEAIDNVKRFLTERTRLGRTTPILVPTFHKCAGNLAEMEQWYDAWLRAVGAAVIAGPSDYAGLIPDAGVADMTPTRRRPCARLSSRMTILSDGRIVACEQDVTGCQVLGEIGRDPVTRVWADRFGALRTAHAAGGWDAIDPCRRCREWHRP